MINRAALLLRYKTPAVHWINEADPSPSGRPVKIEEINEERTVYLIDEAAVDDPEGLEQWLERNYDVFFELELEAWYTEPALWPKVRDYQLFKAWFEPEIHTVIIDTCPNEIFDHDA